MRERSFSRNIKRRRMRSASPCVIILFARISYCPPYAARQLAPLSVTLGARDNKKGEGGDLDHQGNLRLLIAASTAAVIFGIRSIPSMFKKASNGPSAAWMAFATMPAIPVAGIEIV